MPKIKITAADSKPIRKKRPQPKVRARRRKRPPEVDPIADRPLYLQQSLARAEWMLTEAAATGRASDFSQLQIRTLELLDRLHQAKPQRKGLFDLPADERARRLLEAVKYWPLEVLEAAAAELERRRNIVEAG
jgi:hypothetical protein